VVVYVYSVFGFLFFRSHFVRDEQKTCTSLFMCFISALWGGLRSGGGVGDLMQNPIWEDANIPFRIIFDTSFWFLVNIILMNCMFGIIIDTFGELRSQNQAIQDDIKNKCFICGIDRDTFDRHGKGFEHHSTHDHNMWNYLYFRIYLKRKDKTEFTGPEQYIYEKIEQRNWNFVPHLKALCLDQKPDEDSETQQIKDYINLISKETKSHIENLQKALVSKSNPSNDAIAQLTKKVSSFEKKVSSLEQKLDLLITSLPKQ